MYNISKSILYKKSNANEASKLFTYIIQDINNKKAKEQQKKKEQEEQDNIYYIEHHKSAKINMTKLFYMKNDNKRYEIINKIEDALTYIHISSKREKMKNTLDKLEDQGYIIYQML